MTDFFNFRRQLEEAKCGSKSSKSEEKLDPVGKADDDIDNDGDVDSSDEYLKNRRKAISKAMKKEDKGPCWDGYVQLGTKMKDGKEVPNCVPMEEAKKMMNEAKVTDDHWAIVKQNGNFYTSKSEIKKIVKPSKNPPSQRTIEKHGGDSAVRVGKLKKDLEGMRNTDKLLKQLNESFYDEPDYGQAGAAEMKITQLHFIKHAADEIIGCLESGCVMPEWYQNKVAKVEGEFEGLLSYMKGQKAKTKSRRYSMGMNMYEQAETLTESKTVEVSVRDARKANDIASDMFRGEYKTDGSNSFVFKKSDAADDFRAELENQGIELNEDWFYDLVGVKMKDLYFVAKKGYRTNKKVYLQTLHSPTNFGTYWVRDPGDATYFINKRDAEKAAKEHGGKVVTGVTEEAQSGDKEAYTKFFNAALKKFGVKSPAELKGDKEKEFYDYVDKNWKADDEMKNESVQIDEKTVPLDKLRRGKTYTVKMNGKKGKVRVDAIRPDGGEYRVKMTYMDNNIGKKGETVTQSLDLGGDDDVFMESYITEVLKPSDDVSKWIEDFYKSDAPQFKGKDKEARREMAVAAWLEARREAGYDVGPNPNE